MNLSLRIPQQDWILKAISLCLGAFLWYFVVGEDQVDMNIVVPIEILNLPVDLVISNQFRQEIEVSVRGPRSMIQDLRERPITRPVDLSDAEPGTVVIKNDRDSIPFPRGITVLRLQPTNITLQLDRLIQKNFVINPVTEGEPAPGYYLHNITLEPDHLAVSGPKTILDSEIALQTYVINLDRLDHSTVLQVRLNLNPDFLALIGETVVTAKLEVREKMVKKVITPIPINVRDSARPVKIEPHSISVLANIPENLLRDTPEPAMLFRASVSAAGIREATNVPVTVNTISVPGHAPIEILSIQPEQIRVWPMGGVTPDQGEQTKTGHKAGSDQP